MKTTWWLTLGKPSNYLFKIITNILKGRFEKIAHETPNHEISYQGDILMNRQSMWWHKIIYWQCDSKDRYKRRLSILLCGDSSEMSLLVLPLSSQGEYGAAVWCHEALTNF